MPVHSLPDSNAAATTTTTAAAPAGATTATAAAQPAAAPGAPTSLAHGMVALRGADYDWSRPLGHTVILSQQQQPHGAGAFAAAPTGKKAAAAAEGPDAKQQQHSSSSPLKPLKSLLRAQPSGDGKAAAPGSPLSASGSESGSGSGQQLPASFLTLDGVEFSLRPGELLGVCGEVRRALRALCRFVRRLQDASCKRRLGRGPRDDHGVGAKRCCRWARASRRFWRRCWASCSPCPTATRRIRRRLRLRGRARGVLRRRCRRRRRCCGRRARRRWRGWAATGRSWWALWPTAPRCARATTPQHLIHPLAGGLRPRRRASKQMQIQSHTQSRAQRLGRIHALPSWQDGRTRRGALTNTGHGCRRRHLCARRCRGSWRAACARTFCSAGRWTRTATRRCSRRARCGTTSSCCPPATRRSWASAAST